MENQASGSLLMTKEGVVTVVELIDKKILDEACIMRISEQLLALVAQEADPRVVVDFTNVGHMSSSALGMLITLHKRIREKKGVLRLCNIAPSIFEVFKITRLNEIFGIKDSRDRAIKEAAK
jgi:anti-sigma B factor antagonist